jgi:hypothetical protein
MKKIFFLLAGVFTFFACDPIHEDVSKDGHITVEELMAKTTVTVDQAADGQNGHFITCTTSAPILATWRYCDQALDNKTGKPAVDSVTNEPIFDIEKGKDLVGNFSSKKMKIGNHLVRLTAYCADGTVLTANFPLTCNVITRKLNRYWIYGENPEVEKPFSPAAWNAAAMRFSDNEGKFTDIDGKEHSLRYLTDDEYWGGKTLIFDITEASPDCAGRIMNGWWSARYDDNKDVSFKAGLWELPLTETIAKDCARGGGGAGKDLDIMITSGSCTIKAIYYEE